ncbi:DNA invertase Pin-like site-specific DNA recombinase [Litoreibacter meonggei]|uniref:DNA invertase Pin-like site-specific DNA recombinase n=1 Tax=Litoreibacter meonggei TaxID=1049199 RepID=A0A497VEN1_9RHOB|nr:recombinase family protein [Litoreibacter meonggei]RLJ40687.1 DNA invertase Pin-like site-specific DNA recombinase [Litoreibacter meonggei]
MKPCFGYIRVSTVRQGDGASLEAQKDAITGFASQNNIEIVEWYEERETAAKAGRPLFDAMMTRLKRGDAEGLIMHKIDRSSRNYADWARLDEVSQLGVKIHFAADSLDFDSRGGRLLADIQMALAADYSRNLSLEVKKGLYGRLKQGIYPYRAPLGYLDTGGGNLKAIDPIKGPLVRTLFELYGSGEYSITSLTAEMQRRGLKGYGERLVVRRNVDAILNNPFYCGKMKGGGNLYDGKHEPLITTGQFRRIAEVKADRVQKRATKHRLLFRRLLRCVNCQRLLTGERQKTHIYYRCHTADCQQRTAREDALEEQFLRAFQHVQICSKDKETIANHVQAWLVDTGRKDMQKSLQLRLADTKTRQDRLTDLLVDGAIEKPDYDVRKQNYDFELKQLREELAAIEKQRTDQEDVVQLIEFATNLSRLYSATPKPKKRAMIKNCFETVCVVDGVLAATPASWLVELKSVGAASKPDQTPMTSNVFAALGNSEVRSLQAIDKQSGSAGLDTRER